jgi:hypothetical protein
MSVCRKLRSDDSTCMWLRALLVWFGILGVAIGNGAARQGALIPRLGESMGHVSSTVLLTVIVFFAAWLTIRWLNPGDVRRAWIVGVVWLTLTLTFEFCAGRFILQTPWQVLLADYRVDQGRIWILVLVATATAPRLALWLRAS